MHPCTIFHGHQIEDPELYRCSFKLSIKKKLVGCNRYRREAFEPSLINHSENIVPDAMLTGSDSGNMNSQFPILYFTRGHENAWILAGAYKIRDFHEDCGP
jgi:hypothetical protein